MGESLPAFRNYTINRLDRVSIPARASRQLRRKMLNLYVPNRIIAKIGWNFVQYSEQAAKFLRISNQTDGPSARLENFNWLQWTIRIEKILGDGKLCPAFYFPPQNDRKKCSALIFNLEGAPVAYAKIAWGEEEIDQAKKEKDAYLFVDQYSFQHFESPRILYSDDFDGRYYNLFSPFPSDIGKAPQNWSEIYHLAWQELSNLTVQAIPLTNLTWWNDRQMWQDEWRSVFEVVERFEPVSGYRFCKAHGDMSIWNARVRNNKLYLFDWELFETDAPVLLDPFYFFLSRELLLKKGTKVSSVINSILSEFLPISNSTLHIPELLLVITYLRIHKGERNFIEELEELAFALVQG